MFKSKTDELLRDKFLLNFKDESSGNALTSFYFQNWILRQEEKPLYNFVKKLYMSFFN